MENYDDVVKRIQELSTDPDALAAHVANHTQGLEETMPNISQHLGNGLVNSIQFLNSKIPKPKAELPLSNDWEPSESQKQAFGRYVDAVDSPLDVIKQIKDGSLTAESMESLKTVHPDLLQEMRMKLLPSLTNGEAKKLPHDVKRSLNMFLGTPLQNIDNPQVKIANQAAFQALQAQKAQQQQSVGKSTQKGLEQLGLAKRAATETQADEEEKP